MSRSKKEITDAYNSPFPVALRALMREKAITQENIAEATGKTRQTVSQYVNGKSEPGYDTLVKIADYFDVSVDYLLGRTRDRRKEPSIYDNIGLSEESITILRLAQLSESGNTDQRQLFEKILPTKEQLCVDFGCDESNPILKIYHDTMDECWQKISQTITGDIARYLPEFIDFVIEVSLDNPIIIESFAQIINQERRPFELERFMNTDEFVRYKVFEITNYLTSRLLEFFEDYGGGSTWQRLKKAAARMAQPTE